MRLLNGKEDKRRQAPPVLCVVGKVFGFGRRRSMAHGCGEDDIS